jgi:PKD repeat protein
VYRVYYGTRDRLSELAVHYDIWEVRREAGYAVLGLDPLSASDLVTQGYRLELDAERTERLLGPPGLSCYRDVDELYADIQQLVADYADLVTLTDYGDSWRKINVSPSEGYDLLVLRLTNSATPGPKPRFFLMANIHGRELTTPETAWYFTEYLLENYGTDADATWMLDYHEIYVVISANPDGRQLAEGDCMQRKNRNDDDGSCNLCDTWGSNHYGVDLNRNNPYHWGGAGTSYCEQTYQGPTSASEPETVAINTFVRSIISDQRANDDTTPAPDDTTGLLITLHSYSNLVLWPWGFTYNGAPNEVQLRTLGRKFAYFNLYTPQQSSDLYTTTGDTTDWAYGELGIPAYTFELGESFFQPCGDLQTIMDENLGALLYAAKVPRTPYITPAGPDALDVTAVPGGVEAGQPVTLTATIDDTRYNNSNGTEPTQNVAAAAYYIDTPPWVTSTTPVTYTLMAVDGSFDETVEDVEAVIDTTGLAPGRHILFVRGQDTDGTWGAFSAAFLYILEPGVSPVIEGYVQENGVGTPIHATVQAGNFQATTDPATGYYSMTVVSDTYAMSAAPIGGGYATSVVTGVVASDYQTVRQDFDLHPICDIFVDDVESGDPGWTAQGNWAITTESSHSPSHSWTDSPGGNYGNYWDYSLISPIFDLSDYERVALDFWHIYDLEDGYDYGYVEISTDGGSNWTQVATYNGEDQTTWMQETLDLAALDGQTNARFRFRIDSDSWIVADGWHVDDVRLIGGGPGCVTQVITPTASFTSNSPVILGDAMDFTNQTTGTLPITYTWDFGDGVGTSTETHPSYTYASAGTFSVTLVATNTAGSDSVTNAVVVEPCVELAGITIAGPTTGEPGVYTFTTTYTPTEATPPIAYIWNNGDVVSTTVRTLDVGEHTLVVAATNCDGVQVSDTHVITITPPPCTEVTSIDLTRVTTGTIYTDTLVTFEADLLPDDLDTPYAYRITVDGTPGVTQTASADPLSFSHTFPTTGSHNVEIAVWNCEMEESQAVTDVVSLTVYPPETCVDLTDITIVGPQLGESGEYTFTTTYTPDGATLPIAYLWDDGSTLSTSTRALGVGVHTLTITATNCTAAQVIDTHVIHISESLQYIYLPVILRE